jgi:predicted membrane channel-forming protein YqfA (hemolysin III family)
MGCRPFGQPEIAPAHACTFIIRTMDFLSSFHPQVECQFWHISVVAGAAMHLLAFE